MSEWRRNLVERYGRETLRDALINPNNTPDEIREKLVAHGVVGVKTPAPTLDADSRPRTEIRHDYFLSRDGEDWLADLQG